MKKNYSLLSLLLVLSVTVAQAQVVNQIYDHDTTDLNQLRNMPFDESKLLVVSGFSFSQEGVKYHELDQTSGQLIDLTFNNVDTIFSSPEVKDDKLFFEASISGLGRELVAYDGTSTYFFDFNIGSGDSDPTIIKFQDDLYVTASDGAIRQLYKYTGGTTFLQITEEIEDDVVQFIANRGNDYYYTTYNPLNGKFIKTTENNNGVLTHASITPMSFQESIGDVVLLNDNIFLLSYYYTFSDASYRVDRIDVNDAVTTFHFETGGQFSGGHLFAYDNDLLFYRTEPNHTEILNISVPQQPVIQVGIDPSIYQTIGGHVVQNNKLFIYGYSYIMDVSGTIPVPLIEDASTINIVPAFETDSSFYLYEIAPFSIGGSSGIIEVSSITNQLITYPVSDDGGHFSHNHPMVANNGDVTFIFKTEDNIPSTDVYSLSSILSTEEHQLASIDVFPNPTINGQFSIVLPEAGEVNLLTLGGQIVRTERLDAGTNTVQINTLKPGIYLIKYRNRIQRLFVD